MDPLLFLAHRMPYPPNKATRCVPTTSSSTWLRATGVLGTFIDDTDDWQHVDAVRTLCAEVHVEALARARSGR